MNITEYELKTRESIMNFLKSHEYCKPGYDYYLDSFREELYVSESVAVLEQYKKENLIFLMTANDVETGTLHNYIYSNIPPDLNKINDDNHHPEKIVKVIDGQITYYFAKIYNYNIVNVCNKTGAYSEGGSAQTLRVVVEKLNPIIIISTGVAFGIDWYNQSLCDVIIAEKLLVYDKGIKISNGTIEMKREHIVSTESTLIERIKQHRTFIHPKRPFHIHVGDVLTGEAVISDTRFKSMICKLFSLKSSNIVGGEMEGYGAYVEAAQSRIPCITIKGICDWAMLKNSLSDKGGEEGKCENDIYKDGLQACAAINAYIVIFDLLRDQYFFSDYEKSEYRLIQVGRFSLKKRHFFTALQAYSLALSVILFAVLLYDITALTIRDILIAFASVLTLVLVGALSAAIIEYIKKRR